MLVMKFRLAYSCSIFLLHSLVATAAPLNEQLASYAAAAKSADPAFAGFSAARGKTLHTKAFALGKPDTPACTSCHGLDPRGAGKTPTGKVIEPVALSAAPGRYADPAKVEKWFKRNCNEVLGRVCTPLEKGDWLTFVSGQ
jgi:cytochrome c peroxidase